MSEKPILFSAEMVRAILDGRKTQTRRVVKYPISESDHGMSHEPMVKKNGAWWKPDEICPYGSPGDLLWVRESLRRYKLEFCGEDKWTAQYIATNTAVPYTPGAREGWCGAALWQWKNTACPSIFMPRWASRITLKITDVRVERLQDISDADAIAEGVPHGDDFPLDNPAWCPQCDGTGLHIALGDQMGVTEVDCEFCATPKLLFKNLWDSINSKSGYSWSSNPWCWCLTFSVIDR